MTSFHVICGLCLAELKILGTPVNWRSPEKNFEALFFGEHLHLCPWSLASIIPVLGLEIVCPRKGCPWPRNFFVSLASSLMSSTPPLMPSVQVYFFRIRSILESAILATRNLVLIGLTCFLTPTKRFWFW